MIISTRWFLGDFYIDRQQIICFFFFSTFSLACRGRKNHCCITGTINKTNGLAKSWTFSQVNRRLLSKIREKIPEWPKSKGFSTSSYHDAMILAIYIYFAHMLPHDVIHRTIFQNPRWLSFNLNKSHFEMGTARMICIFFALISFFIAPKLSTIIYVAR